MSKLVGLMLSNLKRSHLLMESCNICSTATMGKMFLNSHIKSNTKEVLYHRHTYSFRLWYPNTQICNKCRYLQTQSSCQPCVYIVFFLSLSYSRSLSLFFSLSLFLLFWLFSPFFSLSFPLSPVPPHFFSLRSLFPFSFFVSFSLTHS